MNDDKEVVKAEIGALTSKILASDETGLYSPYEWDIVQLIIEYSIRNHITIPVIKYDLYERWKEKKAQEEEEELQPNRNQPTPPLKRRKVDQPGDYPSEPDYDYFEDFMQALRQEHMIRPRFKLHSDIQELVDCCSIW